MSGAAPSATSCDQRSSGCYRTPARSLWRAIRIRRSAPQWHAALPSAKRRALQRTCAGHLGSQCGCARRRPRTPSASLRTCGRSMETPLVARAALRLHSIWVNLNPTRLNNILSYEDGAWKLLFSGGCARHGQRGHGRGGHWCGQRGRAQPRRGRSRSRWQSDRKAAIGGCLRAAAVCLPPGQHGGLRWNRRKCEERCASWCSRWLSGMREWAYSACLSPELRGCAARMSIRQRPPSRRHGRSSTLAAYNKVPAIRLGAPRRIEDAKRGRRGCG